MLNSELRTQHLWLIEGNENALLTRTILGIINLKHDWLAGWDPIQRALKLIVVGDRLPVDALDHCIFTQPGIVRDAARLDLGQ